MKNTVPGFPETIDIAKSQARRLATVLSGRCNVTHGQALEFVAGLHGERTWGAMSARFSGTPTKRGAYDLGLRPVDSGEPTPTRTTSGWRSDELRRLADVMRAPPTRRSEAVRNRYLRRIVEDGCVVVSQLDELLDTVSAELGDLCFALTGGRIAELFGIETESFLHRPTENDVRTMGYRCVSLAGAASLLAKLERIGFDTRPEILVDAVNRAAAGRRMLARHEIDCLWYLSERDGNGRQRLVAKENVQMEGRPTEVFSTATGHRCAVHAGPAGDVVGIVVAPPGPGAASSEGGADLSDRRNSAVGVGSARPRPKDRS